jgi:hypothetical protein
MNDVNSEYARYFPNGDKSRPRFASKLAWKVRGGNYRDGFAQWVSSYSGVVHIPCVPAAFPERRARRSVKPHSNALRYVWALLHAQI